MPRMCSIIDFKIICYGRVSEWFKELVLKTSVPEMVPWVQIPPLPPDNFLERYPSG